MSSERLRSLLTSHLQNKKQRDKVRQMIFETKNAQNISHQIDEIIDLESKGDVTKTQKKKKEKLQETLQKLIEHAG